MHGKIWFKVEAGEARRFECDGAVAELHGTPDAVRLPEDLGGTEARVLGEYTDECPVCSSAHPVRTLDLEGGLSVVECEAVGFLWCRTDDLIGPFGRPESNVIAEGEDFDEGPEGPEVEDDSAIGNAPRPGERPRFDDPFDEAWYDLNRDRGRDLGAKD